MHRIAAGLLSFVSGNQLTINTLCPRALSNTINRRSQNLANKQEKGFHLKKNLKHSV